MIDGMIAVALFAIASLLFYRWVERRHKILVGKFALAALGLSVLAIGWIWWDSRSQGMADERFRQSVSIVFVPDSTVVGRLASLRSDTIDHVSFRLCNTGSDSVAAVEFSPKSLYRGRSTEYDLVATNFYRGITTEFKSDIILAPNRCETLTWSGQFVVLDTVIAGYVFVDRLHPR